MKIIVKIVLIALIFCQSIQSQVTKQKDLERIEQSKLIVWENNDPVITEFLTEAVGRFWTLSEIVDTLPYNDAKEKIKDSDKLLMIGIGSKQTLSNSTKTTILNTTYIERTLRSGVTVEISDGAYLPITRVVIPNFGDDNVLTRESVLFGVSQLESMLRTMKEKEYSSNMKMRKMYNENSVRRLAKTTLLIPEGWLTDDLNQENISEYYEFPIEIVGYNEWKESIVFGREGFAYAMVVSQPAGNGFIHVIYMVDCNTGRVIGGYWPKVVFNGYNPVDITKNKLKALNKLVTDDL